MTDQRRLAEIVDRITDDLRSTIRDLQITDEEWYTALEFLGEVVDRNEAILLSDVLRLSVVVDEINNPPADAVTRSNVLGPFWRDAPLVDNPGTISADDTSGQPLVVSGTVRTSAGEPIVGAEVDIWQADGEGVYDVMEDRVPRLRGRQRTDKSGRYELNTVVPAPYEVPKNGPVGRLLRALDRHAFRPAHLHYRVSADGYQPLTTMVFVAGDPWLTDDVIGAVKDDLIVSVNHDASPAQLTFDITLRD